MIIVVAIIVVAVPQVTDAIDLGSDSSTKVKKVTEFKGGG